MPELKIFLSYCHRDGAAVEKLFRAIETRGWEVFWDQNVPAGALWEKWIDSELESAFAVIVVWSREALESPAVLAEAERAFERNRLFQVVLDSNVKPPQRFSHAQAIDLSYWNGDGNDQKIDRVLEIINQMADFHRGSKRPFTVKPVLRLKPGAH